MSYLVSVHYNNKDAFYPQATPFVGIAENNIYYNDLWARQEVLTLQGQLTGCTFEDIVNAQNIIINNFNTSFQNLEIIQSGEGYTGVVFRKELVEVESINFDQSRMIGVLPYTIQLSCYPSGLFSGAFGIINPVDSWSFNETQNVVLDATHTIGCSPINTSSGPSNALENARNWAFGRTGIASMVAPILISGVSSENFCLLTQQESIDRINGTYALVENYTNDLARTGYGVVRYTTVLDSGNNGITVNLEGTVQGCNRNMSGVRQAFKNIDFLAVATKNYEYAFGRNDLNPNPVAQSFDENPFEASLAFQYTYTNSNLPPIYFDYNVSLETATNGFITTTINGTVIARFGDLQSRLEQCKTYAKTINLYDLCLPFYNEFDVSSSTPLNPVPITSGERINESNGTVQLNATFTNEQKTSNVLDRFDYSLAFLPSVVAADAQPVLDGLGTYSIVNLGYANRAALTINGRAVTNRNTAPALGVMAVRNACMNLFQQYGRFANASLDTNNITSERSDERVLNFQFSWSFDSPNRVGLTTVLNISV